MYGAGEGDAERVYVSHNDCRHGGPPCPFRCGGATGKPRAWEAKTLTVRLDFDTGKRAVEPPPDFVKALGRAEGLGTMEALAYTHQREHVEAIEEAKKPQTRARRIERAVQMIREMIRDRPPRCVLPRPYRVAERVDSGSYEALQPCLDRIRAMDSPFTPGSRCCRRGRRGRDALRDPVWRERHHGDAGPVHRIRLAHLQRTNRHRRCRDRSRAAPTRSDPAWKDPDCSLRVPNARPHAQPAQSGAHSRRKLQRVGSRRRRRHGAGRAGNPDQRVGAAAGVLLRRDGIQGELRSPLHGRRAPLREEPGHARVLHAHTGRHARALGVDGTSRGPRRRISRWARRIPCPKSSPQWRRHFRMRSRCCERAWRVHPISRHRRHARQARRCGHHRHVLRRGAIPPAALQGVRRAARRFADLVREGLQIPVERYDEARRYIAACKTRVAEMYKATPVILVPAATGPAPLGLASTGDAE